LGICFAVTAIPTETTIAAAGDGDIETIRHLFQQYAASLPFGLEYQNFAAELAGLPGAYAPPRGCLLLARSGTEVLGTVALKPLAGRVAEIKRLYVLPEARGEGLGKALLTRVIDEARDRGYHRIRLDSHRASMAPAIGLYRALGFIEIPPYGPDLDGAIAFFEKRL
jgi:GNAT superfamily N-acetyltransferase